VTPRPTALALASFLAACGGGSSSAPIDTPDAEEGEGGQGGATGGASGKGGAPATGGSGGEVVPPDAGPPAPPPDADTATPPDAAAAGTVFHCPPGPYEAPKMVGRKDICPGFNVKYSWNEGPTWVASQKAFFFSNFVIMEAGPGDMIKYDPATDKCEVFIQGNGCNGLVADHQGGLIATCQTPRALLRFDLTTKKSTVLVDMVEGKKLDSPNDVVIHGNGTIYFSNTTFELGGRPAGGLGSALMRIDPAGMLTVIAKGGINPLGLSPDGKRLYAMGGYWDLDDQGAPLKKNGGFTLGNDGIAVDCAGNVYTNSGGIISPQNQRVGSYPGGTNQAFGGEDYKTLLVVGGKNMHTVQMNLPGIP
jgi:gluconolactonase